MLLAPSVHSELLNGHFVEIDHTRAVTLRRGFDQCVGDGDQSVPDGHPRRVNVDIAPAQAENLTATHTRHRGETPDRLEPSSVHGVEKTRELRWVPRLDAVGQPSRRTRGFRARGDVLNDKSGVECVLESLVNRCVDLADRLCAERPPTVGRCCQLPVERVEHRGRELLERFVTQLR